MFLLYLGNHLFCSSPNRADINSAVFSFKAILLSKLASFNYDEVLSQSLYLADSSILKSAV